VRCAIQTIRFGAGIIALSLMMQMGVLPAAGQTGQINLIGLTNSNILVRFTANSPRETTHVTVSGLTGTLVGIDSRPTNGLLYGVTNANNIYTIDLATGTATLVCTLTVAFDGDLHSGVDFNPQSDRLRLVAKNGQNLRVHADLGATATDGTLAYAATDRNAGTKPTITAVAYTNSIPNAPVTKTFDIDATLDVLVLQEPPNDGVLATVGPLGIDFGPTGGFDILTDSSGRDHAFAASGSTLYAIDLATGAATTLGTIGDGSFTLVGLAAVATP
jgi:Domain of unknown function (DUF4394)